jgi:hypothetical protein
MEIWRSNVDGAVTMRDANGRVNGREAMEIRDVRQLCSTQRDKPVRCCRDMAPNGLAAPMIDPSSELSFHTDLVHQTAWAWGACSAEKEQFTIHFISLLLPPATTRSFH